MDMAFSRGSDSSDLEPANLKDDGNGIEIDGTKRGGFSHDWPFPKIFFILTLEANRHSSHYAYSYLCRHLPTGWLASHFTGFVVGWGAQERIPGMAFISIST